MGTNGTAGEKYCPAAKSEAREGGRRTLKLSDAVQSTTAVAGQNGEERAKGFIIHHLIWPRMTDKRTGPRALRGGRTGNADNSAAKLSFVRLARARSIISIKVLRM